MSDDNGAKEAWVRSYAPLVLAGSWANSNGGFCCTSERIIYDLETLYDALQKRYK